MVHRGAQAEVEITAYEQDDSPGYFCNDGGGTATAAWSVAAPTLAVETEIPDDDEYEVRIYDA
ncbi:MAG: hypothetical protein U0791_19660 [Gemmataceae bacterium]